MTDSSEIENAELSMQQQTTEVDFRAARRGVRPHMTEDLAFIMENTAIREAEKIELKLPDLLFKDVNNRSSVTNDSDSDSSDSDVQIIKVKSRSNAVIGETICIDSSSDEETVHISKPSKKKHNNGKIDHCDDTATRMIVGKLLLELVSKTHKNCQKDMGDDESLISDDEEDAEKDRFHLASILHDVETIKDHIPKVRNEVLPEELPEDEELIVLSAEDNLLQVGTISGIVEQMIVIEADKTAPALDADTAFFLNRDTFLGKVFDTFGPVKTPFYSIRSSKKVDTSALKKGTKCYFVPFNQNITHYVFVEQLKALRGSDASWKDDVEPPPEHLDYSDDEEERQMRYELKQKKRTKRTGNHTAETEAGGLQNQVRKPRNERNNRTHNPPGSKNSQKCRKQAMEYSSPLHEMENHRSYGGDEQEFRRNNQSHRHSIHPEHGRFRSPAPRHPSKTAQYHDRNPQLIGIHHNNAPCPPCPVMRPDFNAPRPPCPVMRPHFLRPPPRSNIAAPTFISPVQTMSPQRPSHVFEAAVSSQPYGQPTQNAFVPQNVQPSGARGEKINPHLRSFMELAPVGNVKPNESTAEGNHDDYQQNRNNCQPLHFRHTHTTDNPPPSKFVPVANVSFSSSGLPNGDDGHVRQTQTNYGNEMRMPSADNFRVSNQYVDNSHMFAQEKRFPHPSNHPPSCQKPRFDGPRSQGDQEYSQSFGQQQMHPPPYHEPPYQQNIIASHNGPTNFPSTSFAPTMSSIRNARPRSYNDNQHPQQFNPNFNHPRATKVSAQFQSYQTFGPPPHYLGSRPNFTQTSFSNQSNGLNHQQPPLRYQQNAPINPPPHQ